MAENEEIGLLILKKVRIGDGTPFRYKINRCKHLESKGCG